MIDEIWKDIPGFETKYRVSNTGRVLSLSRLDNMNRKTPGKLMKLRDHSKGYYNIALRAFGRYHYRYIHRLVASTFIGDPNGLQVNHIDGDKKNNHVDNLEFVTPKENINHAMDIGLFNNKGSLHYLSKLIEEDVYVIKFSGISPGELSNIFNISRQTICDIRKGRTWRHVSKCWEKK